MAKRPENGQYRSFDAVVSDVPRYESFYGVAEHRARDEALAAEHDHVSFEVEGESSDGNEIWSLTVGEGPYTAFMFAAPHPNEPIGSMTIDFLAHRLATDESFRESFDYEFVFVKTADVDGTLLNEGWFDGPFTVSNYAQNFYRPAGDEQVEWTFPIEYEEYEFDAPVPETEVLMDIIAETEPEFIYSLHNAGFGGCYYYISHDLDEIFDDLRGIARERDIPLHLGEPETPWATEFDDAVFETLSTKEHYDYLVEHTDQDPTEMLTTGGSSLDFAHEHNEDAVGLITELPYFYDEQIESETETDRTRREVVLEGADRGAELLAFLEAQLDRVRDHLPDTRPSRAVAEMVEKGPERIDAKRSWAEDAPELEEPATVAQTVDALTMRSFYQMLYFGTFLRVLDHAAMGAEDEETAELLGEVKSTVEARLHELNGQLLEDLDYKLISIRKLVAIQAQAGLICMDYLQHSGRFETDTN
ncbi:hypothetical protein [Halorarum halobium]|uniref:hypothetical protein n=1 Tax=Halorarum halobium TaxID=3075121 RepID=UPI0028A811B0|nr:hypothetical protein [Halobaculum sp. XH14]